MSTRRLRVVEVGAGWGVGGMEQTIEIRAALLDRKSFDVHVVGLYGGPRIERLAQRGVSTIHLEGDTRRLESIVRELSPDVVSYSRPERVCPFSQLVQAACLAQSVPVVVETNIFGRPPSWDQTRPPDTTVHVSLASMLRAARLVGRDVSALHAAGHRVVYPPAPTVGGYGTAPETSREEARARLGIAPHELLACRVTRPDLRKWSPRLEVALPELFRAVPALKFAFMAPPREKREQLVRRHGSRVICLDTESDLARVQALYAASDLMIHSSGIGESFGLSVAEAMAAGLPVVADSTPDMDNAQVELIEHERTGFIVRSGAGFVDAVRALAADPGLRKRMGAAGAERAAARFADRRVVGQWERLYAGACARAGIEMPSALMTDTPHVPSEEEYQKFPSQYASACERALGRAPTPLEAAGISWIRARDVLGYARILGPKAVWRIISSRLRSGSLGRD